jgi:K+-transporting ATPase ATPase C chain
MGSISTQLRPAIVVLILMAFLTGLAYPLLVTGIAQVFLPRQANGSLIVSNGRLVGSELIGQSFDDPGYFWGRLSATGTFPYNAFNAENLTASSGSNDGPLNPALLKAVKARIDALRQADPGNDSPIPVDLVTASASGLDPDISPAAAFFQVPRVARVRGLSEAAVHALVQQRIQPRQLGFLGEPRVDVLELNLALDRMK